MQTYEQRGLAWLVALAWLVKRRQLALKREGIADNAGA